MSASEADEAPSASELPSLNPKEKAVLLSFPLPGEDGQPAFTGLADLARLAFASGRRGSSPSSKGNSWVRNSMRKLLRLKLVQHEKPRSGRYSLTDSGRAAAEAIAAGDIESGVGRKGRGGKE